MVPAPVCAPPKTHTSTHTAMGLPGLLEKALPTFMDKKVTVDSLSAQGLVRAAVDNSSWLHTALCTVSMLFCEDRRAEVVTGICSYYKTRMDMLARCGLKKLVFVFDGARLPAKEATKVEREGKADDAMAIAIICKSALPSKPKPAALANYKKHCNAAVQRTEWIEDALCEYFTDYTGDVEVQFVISIFEADPQIAQLVRDGVVDYAIAEDQDLAMYAMGRYVHKLGYNPKNSQKWNYKRNECAYLDTSKWDGGPMAACGLSVCTKKKSCKTCGPCGTGLSHDQLLKACVLAGCDYVKGVPNIGLSKASDAIRKHKTMDAALKFWNKKESTKTGDDHLEKCMQAVYTFRYQFVCTFDKELNVVSVGHLNDAGTTELGDTEDYLGVCPDLDTAREIVNGVRRPTPPYKRCSRSASADAGIFSSETVVSVSIPTAAELKELDAEGIPTDRLLTRDELLGVLKVRITDVPNADIFARGPEGELLKPQEQLDQFITTTTYPVKSLEHYLSTRNLSRGGDRPQRIKNVKAQMEKEAQFGFVMDV